MHRLGGKRSAAATVTVITETIGHINDDDDDDECPQRRAAENLILSGVHTLHAYVHRLNTPCSHRLVVFPETLISAG